MKFYGSVVSIVRGLLKLMFKVEVVGAENISALSPEDRVIIAPNHISNFDPPVLGAFLPVKMCYMAKEELFRVPVFGSIIRKLGAFPVNRGGTGIGAIKTAIKLLAGGERLLIFPEGRRARTKGVLNEGKSGAVMIAVKAKAYILPIGIDATYKFRGRVKISIGKPIDLSEYHNVKVNGDDLNRITNEILMPEISKLSGAKLYGN